MLMDALLEIQKLTKDFMLHDLNRRISGCRNVSLSVRAGEFVGITGRSGSGKSTILRSVYRTNLPQQGSILYDSRLFGVLDLLEASERQMIQLRRFEIGYISQFLNIPPRTTAFTAVVQSALDAFDVRDGGQKGTVPVSPFTADDKMGHGNRSLLSSGEPRDIERATREARRLLEHFELAEELWDLYPLTFSGGEKLRLNIAAAMVKQPRLLLLDEPTASLDRDSKLKVRTLIERMKDQGCTMLGIFHDFEFMEGVCDREFNMQDGFIDG
ncbi:MAG: ATP-binding cassette domain-containing protein [Coriobacteriales bacterium]|jgi:alpha-D-ribose 1-methylphosphonate 5-triphosphate synthase subunit PhnL|nr:ATP-binding cassette domain-containing protein [Coriobacteriales bacterium]